MGRPPFDGLHKIVLFLLNYLLLIYVDWLNSSSHLGVRLSMMRLHPNKISVLASELKQMTKLKGRKTSVQDSLVYSVVSYSCLFI